MESLPSTIDDSSLNLDGQEQTYVTEKLVIIHPEKKPTIQLNDFVQPHEIYNSLGMGPSFGCFKPDPNVKMRHTNMNAFVESILLAYVHHLPLILAPDDVWTVIMQGFGLHMEKNAEELRSKFVDFEGKKDLVYFTTESFYLMKNPNWGDAFANWSEQIKGFIGEKNHQTLVPKFSTTGVLQQQVFNTSLMKSMESYFRYVMMCGCGIPVVKMLGTLDDWQTLRKRTEALDQYGCAEWVDALLPIIDKFIAAYQGEVDVVFWDMCAKMWPSASSGIMRDSGYAREDRLTGWVLNFFPYASHGTAQYSSLKELREVFGKRESGQDYVYDREMKGKHIPCSYAKVPFTYKEVTVSPPVELNMTILTGFAGMSVDKDNFIRPQIGWSIHCHDSNKKNDAPADDIRQMYRHSSQEENTAPQNPMDQIDAKSSQIIQSWSKEYNIDISHLLNAKKLKFDKDASLDDKALSSAWHRHEEIIGRSVFRQKGFY